MSISERGERARLLFGRSVPTGIAALLLIVLGLWYFADESFPAAIALAMIVLALAAFCPEPS